MARFPDLAITAISGQVTIFYISRATARTFADQGDYVTSHDLYTLSEDNTDVSIRWPEQHVETLGI